MNKQELEYKTKIILDDDTIGFVYEENKTTIIIESVELDITYNMLHNLSLLYQTSNINISAYARYDYVRCYITLS
jgi:hypothetical protein